MSCFKCPHCGELSYIFGSGGACRTTDEMDMEFLGEVWNWFQNSKYATKSKHVNAPPGSVNNFLVVVVIDPSGLEVELLRQIVASVLSVQHNGAVIRSYDGQVKDRGVREGGAPRNGNEGPIKALLDKLDTFPLIRPSERDTSGSHPRSIMEALKMKSSRGLGADESKAIFPIFSS
ncbi:hypothetical protein GIB67_028960 [Kingdonia uniflora]|uniref:Uncharacterized protein n=1 Tax=Kingdonia uniflora TaxID=39325 RepID=A0A7J7LCA6_9MAGN|nr:hypothetical protein GIB67_028960 [Kingdonia uniflora]